MGDPKKTRKKYSGPRHPWIKENIEFEKELIKEYALKNKKEIYKMNSLLKNFKDQAKKLIAAKTKQAEKEKKQLMESLQKLGLIPAESTLDQILGLEIKNIMDRRLQSLVYKKALAKTLSQARQLIVHRHIMIGNKLITSPKHLVPLAEEDQICFIQTSSFINPDHPERVGQVPQKPAEEKTEKKETKKEEKKPLNKSKKGLEKPKDSQKPTKKKLSSKSEKDLEKSKTSPKTEKKETKKEKVEEKKEAPQPEVKEEVPKEEPQEK